MNYYWIVVTAGIFMFIMGFGIGANDVANNFGSSVGSGAITLLWAIVIAAIAEFAGAALMGSTVTESVRKGVIDLSVFDDQPYVMMLGNLSALISGSICLLLASHYGLPVSTTHTIIGALIGFALATGNPQAVNWWYVGKVVLSWIVAPIIAGIFGACIFALTRWLILRKEDPIKYGRRWLWSMIGLLTISFSFLLVFKNPMTFKNISCYMTKDDVLVYTEGCIIKKWAESNILYGVLISIALGIILGLILTPLVYWRSNRVLIKLKDKQDMIENSNHSTNKDCILNISSDDSTEGIGRTSTASSILRDAWKKLPFNQDINIEQIDDEFIRKMHNGAEIFSIQSEKFFTTLQVVSAVASCLIHGANDVANAVAPFASIWSIYSTGGLENKVSMPHWVLMIGGLSISCGLAVFGANVIRTLGMKLVKITPSRGFAIEVGMTITMLIGTFMGLPISSTQSQVGSTVGVGIIDKRDEPSGFFNSNSVNGKQLLKCFGGWIFALILAGTLSALIFSFAAYSPSIN